MKRKKAIFRVIEKEAHKFMYELFMFVLIGSFSFFLINSAMPGETKFITSMLSLLLASTILGGLYLISWILFFLKHVFLTFIDAPIKKSLRRKSKKKRRSFWSKIDWK